MKPVNTTLEPDEKPAIMRVADTSLKKEGVISGEPDAEIIITGRNLAMELSAIECSREQSIAVDEGDEDRLQSSAVDCSRGDTGLSRMSPLLRMEGVRLETKDGETVATGRVLEACCTVVRVRFDIPFPPGTYRLVVTTRNGRGARTNPAVAKRELTVGG